MGRGGITIQQRDLLGTTFEILPQHSNFNTYKNITIKETTNMSRLDSGGKLGKGAGMETVLGYPENCV